MRLSIIIPCYNERGTLPEILRRVMAVRLKGVGKELILVDDGSEDGTAEFIRAYRGRNVVKVFHSRNRGKGASVREGLERATGDIVLVQDADLEYDPSDYPRLLEPIVQGRADVVYGSRFLKSAKARRAHRYLIYYIGNKVLSAAATALYGRRVSDPETCYKVMKRAAVRNMQLESSGFDIEAELTARLLKSGCRIAEVPVSYDSRSMAEGKKITWRDGIRALYLLVKYRFGR